MNVYRNTLHYLLRLAGDETAVDVRAVISSPIFGQTTSFRRHVGLEVTSKVLPAGGMGSIWNWRLSTRCEAKAEQLVEWYLVASA